MSSASPRTRIDQFFGSRKRKPPSVKDENPDKDSRSTPDGSPSAKGTLDGYLVKSPDAGAQVTHPHTPVKRNLTREISFATDATRRPDLPPRPSGAREHPGNDKGPSSDQLGAPDKTSANDIGSCDVGISDQAPEKETFIESNDGNLELRRFATDFLSLYCSELPSAMNIPGEQEVKGQKRNISPSLLVAGSKTCAKKQCFFDESDSTAEAEDNSSAQGCPETVKSEMNYTSGEAAVVQPMEPCESGDKAYKESDGEGIAFLGLRRCTRTPNPNLIGTGITTPGSLANPGCTSEIIKSASRSSMFSPGDEFWNEAIEVADGLFDPVDKLPESMCFLKSGRSSKKLLKDKSFNTVAQGAGNVVRSANNDLEARDAILDGRARPVENPTKETEVSPAVVQNNKVSPLPVKHFDFSQEECNGIVGNNLHCCILEKTEGETNVESGLADSSSLNYKRVQSSNILKRCEAKTDGQNFREKPNYSSNMPLDMNPGDPSFSYGKSPQIVEQASDLAVVEGDVGPSTRVDGINHMHNEKNLSAALQVTGCDTSKVAKEKSKVAKEKNSRSSASRDYEEASTPSSSMPLKDRLQLTSWLPSEICSIYMKKGISKIYPWQVDCLLVNGVLEKRNLVYCASTSAGKSFVAEILMLKRIISTGKIALLVLPYVSICAEKAEHLEMLLEPLGKHVRSFYGNQGGGSLPKDTSVAVCTIEKANSLVNRLLEEGRLSEVGIIVIDELHMVGDQHRGYLLELMLTKLRYAAGEGTSESCSGESSGTSSGKADPAHGLQIVGMSATMPNITSVADWLQAALYQTDFRPVPLEEYVKVGNTIFDKKMDVVRMIPKTADLGGKDPDHIVELCNEVVQEGHSVLLFCSSRKGCESTARHVSRFLKEISVGTREGACEFRDASSAIEALRRCPAGLDPILEETLPSGVAYHHAGLTVEEREIIETCYRKGLVRVLTATSTLAAGVNLPARRVIFRQPRVGRDFIDGTRYRQMAGRAGRTGIDTRGESILICKPDEVRRISAILNDSCPPLQSCLSEDKNGMTHAILEVVAGGIVQTASDVHRYVRCTLLNSTKPFQDVVRSAQDSLRWLCHKKFLEWNEETRLYSTTPLGRAAFGSSLTPEESLIVLEDLSRAREGFVLASDLHLVYLVTPINVDVEPDWELYYERFMQLSALDQSVGNRVGVVEPFLMRMAHGAPMPIQDRLRGKKSGPRDRLQTRSVADDNNLFLNEQTLRVSKRFYVALMLSRLVQEVPVADVCEAFKVARGMIQALQENAGRFASMVSLFCERLGWHDLEGLVAKFQNRISFGVRAEIVELTTIPFVKGSRARALYKAGLRTPLAIAEASISEIAKALFESSAWAGQEGAAVRRVQMGIAKKIKNGARKIILDQAEEARLTAFSAFKSLGVHVPQFSKPLLSTIPEDSFTRGASMTSSGEDDISPFDGKESEKDTQLAASPAVVNKNICLGNTSRSIIEEKLADTRPMTVDTVGEVNTARPMQFDCNTTDAGALVEASSVYTGPPVTLPNNGARTSGTSDIPEVTACCDNGVPDVKLEHDHMEGNIAGGNQSNCSNGSKFDRGPIHASSFPGGFDSFLNKWAAVSEFYFDVHFSKRSELHPPILFEIFGLAICWENSPVYYVNISKDLLASGKLSICGDVARSSAADTATCLEDAKNRWKRIAEIMRQNGARKLTWNLKIQIQVLKFPCISIQRLGRLGIEQIKLNGLELIDTSYILLPSIYVYDGTDMCLVAWILWPDEESKSPPNLEKVVKKRLSSGAAAAANRDGRWRSQMHKAAHNGCCRRVAQTRALGHVLWKLLVSENLVEALTRIESPLVKVLADMELWGIGVDMEACLHARHILVKKLKELEKEAYTLAGMTFSLYTAADIANVLYTRLQLPIPQSCKKGKLHPSTDKNSLDLLRGQHPIISVIKEHRTLAKLLNSTVGSICSRTRLCMKSQKYTIQGHWLQTSTATGRLSMEEPNLQCVEHLVVFTTKQSDKNNSSSSDTDCHKINARGFFVPTQDNWLLLTADYSQIELRMMAHFSKDSLLTELLSKPDGDVFTMLAATWMGKLEPAISSQERDQTKRLVYGILYGMGTNSLAEQLECSYEDAAEKIQSFKSSFPGVTSWLHEAVATCRHKGYVETLMGRKRYLSKIKFGNNKEKAKAQRQAVNSICQGSAADIIKIAMINIHSVIEGSEVLNPNTGLATKFPMLKGRCRILLQVHDELVLEVDSNLKREAAMLLKLSMESAVSLLVPLRVKLMVGRTWGSLEPFQPEP